MDMSDTSGEEQRFSPSDFMRSRRPELFSDAIAPHEEPPIDPAVFEYHLDTLTSRKEETRFEHFCRKLAEKELCPNLLPQTGPTGGGDSKVDSETYPVDESIAERWYAGEQQAAHERWAFAFSAKKDWRPKVKSDVEKIAATDRGYVRVYFITNQAVSDRNRALVEDELSKQTGLDVRILDRSWIVDRVVQNKRWDVVYQTLDLKRPRLEEAPSDGPLDTARRNELSELEASIGDQSRYVGTDYQLVEDCLQVALLARGLGMPRTEVEGRFSRAERLARKRGNPLQLSRVLYYQAWTAFWWFDDFAELDRLYDEIESLVIGSDVVWHLEDLQNLWQIGVVNAIRDGDDDCRERWKGRTASLKSALEVFAADSEKPTSSLWARTELCLIKFTLAAIRGDDVGSVLGELNDILLVAEGHLEYPFAAVVQIVTELGPVLGQQPGYDELFETSMKLQSHRAGSAEEGRLRLERGAQKLEAGDFNGAISHFAKAQTLLAHEEDIDEFLRAVAGTALGYEAAGLTYASRANLIFALDRCLHQYEVAGAVAPQAVPLLRKLIWIELELGRLSAALQWVDMLNVVAMAVPMDDSRRASLEEEHLIVEAVVCIMLLRTDLSDWTRLGRVPAYLESLGLPMARGAALFALGHEAQFRVEFEQPDEDLDEFFGMLMHQPAARQVPERAEWFLEAPVVLRTTMFGCSVEVVAEADSLTIAWAEVIVGFIEAFFATAMALNRTMSMRSRLEVRVRPGATEEGRPLEVWNEEDEFGESFVVVEHAEWPVGGWDPTRFEEAFVHLLSMVLAELTLADSTDWLETYFAEERAHERSHLVAQSIKSTISLLGQPPKYSINDRIGDEVSENLGVERSEQWQPAPFVPPDDDVSASGLPTGDTPDLVGLTRQRHLDVEVQSVINIPLWNRARWRGVVFLTSEDPRSLPVLALYFEDGGAGSKILAGWLHRFGRVDSSGEIAVSVITGIDADNPAHYRVAVGSKFDPTSEASSGTRYFGQVLRFQEMTPASSENLDRFLSALEASGGCYFIASAGGAPPDIGEVFLGKADIRVVPAWQIGPNDLLTPALLGVQNPIIPADVEDAPVIETMKRHASKETTPGTESS